MKTAAKRHVRKNISIYIGLLLIYLLSGSYIYEGYAIVLLGVAVVYSIFFPFLLCRIKLKNFWTSFSFLYLLLVFLSMVIWGISDNTFVTYLIVPLFSYSVFQQTTFREFRQKWLNITFLISIWSLFAFILFQLGYTPSVISFSENDTSQLIWGINIRVHENRLSGLSFEPGVFQILLIYTLIMWVKDFRNKLITPTIAIKLLFCIFALICTQSTMGYLCLIVVIGALIASPRYISNNLGKTILISLLFIPLIVLLYNSPIVQNKLNEEDGNYSYSVRMMDTVSVWSMIEDSPVLGNGLGQRWAEIAASRGNVTNSNGVLDMISRLGIFWFIFYILFLWKNSKKNNMEIMPGYFAFAVLLPLLNEDLGYTPIAFLFVSPYLEEKLDIEIINSSI